MSKKESKEESKKLSALDIVKRYVEDSIKQGWPGVHSVYGQLLDEKGNAIKGLSLNDALRQAGFTPESQTNPSFVKIKNSDGTYTIKEQEGGQLVKDGYIHARYTKGGVFIKPLEKLGITIPEVVEGKAEPKKEKISKATKVFNKVFSK